MSVTSSRARNLWIILGLTGVGALALVSYEGLRRARLSPLEPASSQLSPGPPAPAGARPEFDSPFRNTARGVAYVGDEVCAGCHRAYAQSFAQHPMGQSLAPIAQARTVERFDAMAKNPFEALGFQYAIERRGEQFFHREVRKDAQGRVVTDIECEVQYVVGSGSHGRSYLIEHDGIVRMSPITWYPEKGLWDLSPGYTQHHHHFSRPVTAECLFCHCNQVQKTPQTYNRYEKPLFRGFSVGCERCHGPGELHVQARERDDVSGRLDYTIVNPKHLAPALRDAICEQCHLQGDRRVLRRGRDTFDFRPGLPLHEFMSVFVRVPELTHDRKFVGQVDQMRASKCFIESKGKLGCVSCHDPHRYPTAAERVGFYRQRCLNCHANQGCSVPIDERRRKSPEDSCMQCHLPRSGADIAHISISDHRVLRRAEAELEAPKTPSRVSTTEMPLAYFHQHLADPKEPGIQRDLGIALVEVASNTTADKHGPLCRLAVPLLQRAVANDPKDVDALDALAQAFWLLGHIADAMPLLERVLEQCPEREPTLDTAATVYVALARYPKAIECWERAIQINPQRWRYYTGLATAHARLREWSQAIYSAEQALKLDPTLVEARIIRITGLLNRGDKVKAEAEFEILMGLNPPNAEDIRRRFEELKR